MEHDTEVDRHLPDDRPSKDEKTGLLNEDEMSTESMNKVQDDGDLKKEKRDADVEKQSGPKETMKSNKHNSMLSVSILHFSYYTHIQAYI